MYKEAEKQINSGLSLVPRIILGSVSGLFGVVLIFLGADGYTHKVANWFGYFAIGMFCSLIALVCVTWGRVRQFIGSCIGVIIFVLACGYLVDQLAGGILMSGKRSEPSVLNAILFMIAFGVPGLAYALKARFGLRKREGE